MKEITIETLDLVKNVAQDLITDWAMKLQGVRYADIRIEASEARSAVASDGNPVSACADWEISFGVRVIAGKKMLASGYYGRHLGTFDLKKLSSEIKAGISHARQRALANAQHKLDMKERFGSLAGSLCDTILAPVEIHRAVHQLPFLTDPRQVPLEKAISEVVSISKNIQQIKEVIANEVIFEGTIIRKLFLSSEGASIDFTFPITAFMPFIITQPEGEQRSVHYDCLGDLAGWEVVEGHNVYSKDARTFALDLAAEAARLSRAPILPSSGKEAVVVTDPHYNALLVHEIVGHPVELDRILKWETGYAGRSRLFKSFERHQIGQQVASPLVTALSDPTLLGFGYLPFDDEGVRARKVVHINKGILTADFLNSRETAAVMQAMGMVVQPNGAMRARDPIFVPLVRMTNTVFAPGDRCPEDIIREVDEGYYFKGCSVPSISESRENFRISAREVWKIEKGELTTLYRWGSISSDSETYLKSIDAVGNDFKLYPIPNCGKGQPMQTIHVGNGGPTMRGRAKVAGEDMRKGGVA